MSRPMFLAYSGWYKSDKEACKREIENYIDTKIFIEGKIPISAIVPHAGWYFCGDLSVNCIRVLKEKNGDIDNVFIFGGHLAKENFAILETFDVAETPFGVLKNNQEVIDFLKSDECIQTIEYIQDNTIEILFPIIHYFFGSKISVTAIYLPPHIKIMDMIEKIFKKYGNNSVFIGSTDLTHYGPNYGFFHGDDNISGIDWVKNVNDKKYIDLLLNMKGEESLQHALKNKSACSSGAALGALLIGKHKNVKSGSLIGYSTSYDKHKSSSFVGYVGILY